MDKKRFNYRIYTVFAIYIFFAFTKNMYSSYRNIFYLLISVFGVEPEVDDVA